MTIPPLPRAAFGLAPLPPGLHAVVLSWHLAPEPGHQPAAEPLLGFWAEPLMDALAEAGARVTLLLPLAEPASEPAEQTGLGRLLAARGMGLAFAEGFTPAAVDAAIAALAPDVVHAPEREGLLVAALSRRAAGLAHRGCAMLLHARGPQGFRHAEEARFTPSVSALGVAARERQAMRLADAVLCASPEVAAWWAAEGQPVRRVAPLAWRAHPVPAAPPRELVLPLPLASEAGLEFALFALGRAAGKLRLPVVFAGVPGPMVLGSAAQALGGLAGKPLDWRLESETTPQAACARLLRPGTVALLPSERGTPPELFAFCAMAGVPVLTTPHAVAAEAAARYPGRIHAFERQERPFAAMLARLPELPPAPEGTAAPDWPAPPLLLAPRPLPAAPAVTLVVEAPPPEGAEEQGVPLLLAEPGGLRQAVLAAGTPFVALAGGARHIAPGAVAAMARLACVAGSPAVTAWDNATQPLGGAEDLAAVRPDALLGHLLLLEVTALPTALAALGTPGFAAALAREAGEVFCLPEPLAHAGAPPPPATPAEPLFAGPYRGIAAMARHDAALEAKPLSWRDGQIVRAMEGTSRGSPEYLKLLALLAERQGFTALAIQAWQARARALPEDLEALEQPILLSLRPDGRPQDVPPMIAALAALLARTGQEEGQHLPGLALRRVLELAALGDEAGARALLAGIAAHFPVPPAFALLWPGELP